MVTLKKLKLSNFLSHKDTTVSFNENTKLSIQGVSGSGKSSIVESILWVFFGKGRVENRNIIKRGAKFATVVLEVLDGNKAYRIERGVTTTGKHTLDIGEKKAKAYIPMKHVGLRDAQEWIEKQFLKSSYTLFINSVAYPQDNVESFVKQTAIKRKELLLEIADTENYDELYNSAKSKLDELREQSIRTEMTLAGYNSDIEKKELLIKESDELFKKINVSLELIANIETRIGEAKAAEDYIRENESQISNNRIHMDSMKSRVLEASRSIDSKKSKIAELKYDDTLVIENSKEKLESVRATLEKLRSDQRGDYEANLKRQAIMNSKRPENDYSGPLGRLEGQLLEVFSSNDSFCEHLGRICPRMEQEIKNKTILIENQIKDIKERQTKQEEDNRNYEKELLAIPLPVLTPEDYNKIKELEQEEKTLIQYNNQVDAKKERVETVNYLNKEVEELEMNILMLRGDIDMMVKVNEDLVKDIQGIKKEDSSELQGKYDREKTNYLMLDQKIKMIKQAETDIEMIKSDKKDLIAKESKMMADKECLEIAKEAFGSKGIKTVVIDYLIPRLEFRINEILSKMSDFKIRLETQKGKFDGDGMSEGLFINIYNEMGECFPLANYSGGQKLKITVAISEALATMQKSGFRIFDEIFVGLDENSIEGFNEVIHSLQEKFSQILCISHLRTIQDSFEEKLLVVKEGDNSKIYE